MTPQEIFDTVSTHLITQGHPAKKSKNGKCVYRAPNGDMCAVGCLIKDYYVPEMDKEHGDGTSMPSLLKRFGDILPSWMGDYFSLLQNLQDIHDNDHYWLSIDCMKAELRDVAKKFELNSAILDQFNKFGKQS